MAMNDKNWGFLKTATGLSLPYNDLYRRYLKGLGGTGTLQDMIGKSKKGLNPAPNSKNPPSKREAVVVAAGGVGEPMGLLLIMTRAV